VPVLAALLVASLAVAACGWTGPTPAPQSSDRPIGATPWPAGPIGQYGLHIDPSLLARLPQTISALPLVEDAYSESSDMDNADLAKNFDSFAAASIGQIADADWLEVAIGQFKPAMQSPDVWPDEYASWVEQYATGACSQADAVSGTGKQQIGDWTVDVSTCAGGVVVYTLPLGNGEVLSMFGAGARDLGRKLIQILY
jgi:hypothetical protein